ncbi:MAG: hypothetical protein ACUVTM_06360 [Candidatus Bathyarchaeia archaeon]
MTFKETYWGVIDTVKSKVDEVTDLKTVIFGEKLKIYDFPVAFIIPVRDPISDETLNKVRHHIGIRIVVVDQGTEPEPVLTNTINIACDVYDKIMADRTLNGKCNYIYPVSFEPEYSIAESKTLSWVVIEISCHLLRLEGEG